MFAVSMLEKSRAKSRCSIADFADLTATSKRLNCAPVVVGEVKDHVHLLACFGRTITQAEWFKALKRVSNEWIQNKGIADFQWQAGDATFSVSQSHIESEKGSRRRLPHPEPSSHIGVRILYAVRDGPRRNYTTVADLGLEQKGWLTERASLCEKRSLRAVATYRSRN